MKTRIARKKSHATSLSLCLLVAVGWLAVPPAAHSERHRLTFRQTYLGTGNPYTSGTAVADFNGDGHADLAVPSSSLDEVLVYNGDGRGRFGPPATYPGGNAPDCIITGDFNGDGEPVIVLGDNAGGSVGVQILLNDGKGGFDAPAFIPLDAGFSDQIVTADFNRDGKLDLVLSLPPVPGGHALSGTVLLLGDGSGGFGAPIVDGSSGLMAVGDFNVDGNPDLAVAGILGGPAQLDILLGNGFGGFTLANFYVLGDLGGGVATADFNHDGHIDVAVLEGSEVDVVPGNGDGSFGAPTIVPSNGYKGLVAVDLNGDGNVDLATADIFLNAVSAARGDGKGGFGLMKDFPLTVPMAMAPGPNNITAGDFNGDGLPDLVTSDYWTGGATVLVNLYR